MVGKVAEVEDAGTAATIVRSGVTSLGRTAGKASLTRGPGETSLVRTILRATLACPRCYHHEEGMTTTAKTRGLGASRSHVLSPAS